MGERAEVVHGVCVFSIARTSWQDTAVKLTQLEQDVGGMQQVCRMDTNYFALFLTWPLGSQTYLGREQALRQQLEVAEQAKATLENRLRIVQVRRGRERIL
jgi:hypothetical protein